MRFTFTTHASGAAAAADLALSPKTAPADRRRPRAGRPLLVEAPAGTVVTPPRELRPDGRMDLLMAALRAPMAKKYQPYTPEDRLPRCTCCPRPAPRVVRSWQTWA
jgi:hypothetical protein